MSKTPLSPHFSYTNPVSSLYSSMAYPLNDTKLPLESKSKKTGVKFEIENDKESIHSELI
jgi:hypothetical protein